MSGIEKATLELVGGDQVQEPPQLGDKRVIKNMEISEGFFLNLLLYPLILLAHMLH